MPLVVSTSISRTKVPSGTYFLLHIDYDTTNVYGRFPKQPNRWPGGSLKDRVENLSIEKPYGTPVKC